MQNNIGLQNNGNTCFLNSTMQLIKSSDKFIESSINRFIYYSILANRPSHQPAKEDEDEESDNLTSIYNTLLGILDSEKLNRNRYGMFSYLSRFKSNNNNSNDEASNNVKTYTAFIFLMLEIHYRLYRHHHAAENAPAESADGLQSSSEEEEGSEEEGTPSIGGSCIVHSSAGTPTSPYFPILTRKMSESINNSSREALSPTPERKTKKKKKPEADHVLNKYRDPAIYMNPNYFVNVCPQPFCNGRQHDSSEFSKVLFDVIDMEEKKGIIAHMMNSEEGTSPDNDNAYAASVISSVYKYFGTVLLSEIKCLACQTVRRTNKEHMIDLVLPVLPKNTTPIEKINRTYTKEEEVEVEETEYITRPKETHIFEDAEGEEKKSEPAADSEKENTEDKSKTEESGEEKPAEKDTNDNIFYENESDISLDGEEGKNSVHETIVRKVTTTVTKHFVNKTKYTIFYDLQLLLFMQNDSLFNKELLSGDNKLECEKCKEKTDSLLFSRIVSNKITKEEEKEASSFSQLLSVEEKLFANDNHQSCPVYLTITLNINSNSISKNSSIINGNEIIFLPLTADVKSGQTQLVPYVLKSIIIHSGYSTNSGHYYCVTRDTAKRTSIYDTFTEEEQQAVKAYIEGYARCYSAYTQKASQKEKDKEKKSLQKEEALLDFLTFLEEHHTFNKTHITESFYSSWICLNDSSVSRLSAEEMKRVLINTKNNTSLNSGSRNINSYDDLYDYHSKLYNGENAKAAEEEVESRVNNSVVIHEEIVEEEDIVVEEKKRPMLASNYYSYQHMDSYSSRYSSADTPYVYLYERVDTTGTPTVTEDGDDTPFRFFHVNDRKPFFDNLPENIMELLEKRYNGEDIHAPRTPPASQNLSDSEERDTSAEADGKKFSSPKSASDSERADDSSSREEEEAPATATALQEEESDNTGSGEEKKTSDGVNDIHKEHLAFYRKYDMSD